MSKRSVDEANQGDSSSRGSGSVSGNGGAKRTRVEIEGIPSSAGDMDMPTEDSRDSGAVNEEELLEKELDGVEPSDDLDEAALAEIEAEVEAEANNEAREGDSAPDPALASDPDPDPDPAPASASAPAPASASSADEKDEKPRAAVPSGWASASTSAAKAAASSTSWLSNTTSTSHFASFGSSPAATFGGISSASASKSVFGTSTSGDAEASMFAGSDVAVFEEKVEKAKVDTVTLTGEEDEDTIFQCRAKLYVLIEEQGKEAAWREQGTGQIKINVPQKQKKIKADGDDGSSAPTGPRLVMRREGVYKLILNALVWGKMPREDVGERMVRFSVRADEGADDKAFTVYLAKFARKDDRNEFSEELKGVCESEL